MNHARDTDEHHQHKTEPKSELPTDRELHMRTSHEYPTDLLGSTILRKNRSNESIRPPEVPPNARALDTTNTDPEDRLPDRHTITP
jgi:hypothetical protein